VVEDRLDVGAGAGVEVVYTQHFVALVQQAGAKVGANKAGAAGHHDALGAKLSAGSHEKGV
jgi:hypothetical protein